MKALERLYMFKKHSRRECGILAQGKRSATLGINNAIFATLKWGAAIIKIPAPRFRGALIFANSPGLRCAYPGLRSQTLFEGFLKKTKIASVGSSVKKSQSNFKIISKNYISLLEVLIATVLTTVLLTSLTFFYRDISVLNAELDKLHVEQFQQSYLQKRLSTFFPKIIAPKAKEKDFYFFKGALINGSPSLVFTYDNGPSLDRTLAGNVLGRLFIDKNNNLVLGSWPAPSRWTEESPPWKMEILMGNVERLNFRFYIPPEHYLSHTGGKNHLEGVVYNQWIEEWPAHFRELPALLTLQIKQKGVEKPIEYAYQLPNSNLVIMYEEGQ